MAKAMVVGWAWSLLLLFTANAATGIGINWGSRCAKNLPPNVVVTLLKDNGIDKIKFLDADPEILKHFAKTGIEVMVGITNQSLEEFSNKYDAAKEWVDKNVHKHVKEGVDIRYVSVGNEALSKEYNDEHKKTLLPAMQNVQKALNVAGLGEKIKATTTFKTDVLYGIQKVPSERGFHKDVADIVVEIVKWFAANKSPFIINMNPFRDLRDLNESHRLELEYGLFDSNVSRVDKGKIYTNAFDEDYDAVFWALKNAGVPNVEIIVGEIGWPTDGMKNASIAMAKRFYDGFVKKITTDIGTPLRPKQHIEAYILSLLDENMRSIASEAYYERHWGIFTFDGKVKFPIDLTGKGRADFPVPAKGVTSMGLWCLLNPLLTDLRLLNETMSYACEAADCTVMKPGASCENLTFPWNVSYAYNIYYQMNNQDSDACNFNGYGTMFVASVSQVVTMIPSMANVTCPFPTQIVSSGTRDTTVVAVRSVIILLIFSVIGW